MHEKDWVNKIKSTLQEIVEEDMHVVIISLQQLRNFLNRASEISVFRVTIYFLLSVVKTDCRHMQVVSCLLMFGI